MPKSMTGFGRGECTRYHRRFKVELKSVNHRFSEFVIKLPRFLNPFEDKIRRRLGEDIARGKVDVYVSFDSYTQKDISVSINESFADAYVQTLKNLTKRYNLGELQNTLTLELLAKNSEVIAYDKFETALSSETFQNEIWETLSEALEQALEQYNQMRLTEGIAMLQDMQASHAKAAELVSEIKDLSPILIEEQAAKLNERITEFLAKMGQKIDESRVLTEVALLADKSCISEEISRLESHLNQLSQMFEEQEAIGRKMDFLAQELNREANTIGSKSSNIQMTKLAVELKSVIEKIREQVQNIE